MKSAIDSISGSPIPRRVTSMLPRRRPPGRSQASARSLGIRFLFVMMFACSSRRAIPYPCNGPSASRLLRIADPIAVPRAVVRPSIALSSCALAPARSSLCARRNS